MAKAKQHEEYEQQIGELTADMQRIRADFENYRKRVEMEKTSARDAGEAAVVLKLLPVIDTIERAILHIPGDLADHPWAKGVAGVVKQLDSTLTNLNLKRLKVEKGMAFDPQLHTAVQFDDESEGDHDIVAEELQPGYEYRGVVIRPAMVKVEKGTLLTSSSGKKNAA